MSDIDFLSQGSRSGPFVLSNSSDNDVTNAALRWAEDGITVRAIRGRKSRALEGLFNEVSAALQFPYYFGENWPALAECVADLDWLPITKAFVLVVFSAGEVLAEESGLELASFIGALTGAFRTFSEPIALGEWWDRPAIPFHVVLQVAPSAAGSIAARWSAAGAGEIATLE